MINIQLIIFQFFAFLLVIMVGEICAGVLIYFQNESIPSIIGKFWYLGTHFWLNNKLIEN